MTAVVDQLQEFVEAIFAPDDLVEIRMLPSGDQRYCKADEIGAKRSSLEKLNRSGQNIYVSANPREREGGTAADVALARNLFADFDRTSIEEAERRIEEAALPYPTVVVSSGHGVHAYWALDEPLTDLREWSGRQRALARALESDAVHDPPRVMRLPGFLNVKEQPHVPCHLVKVDTTRQYPIDEFPDAETNPSVRICEAADGGGTRFRHGERNNALMSLAGTMRQRGMTEPEMYAALSKVNADRCGPPLEDSEVRDVSRSAARYSPATNSGPVPLTDLGNAQRLIHRRGDDLLYSDPRRSWLVYDGTRWATDEVRRVEAFAVETVRAIYNEAGSETGDERRKRLGDWARASESRQRLDAMIDLARHIVPVTPDRLDTDPYLLNALNATIDLRTGEVRPHRREDLITKVAPVIYDANAHLPLWDKVLRDATGGYGSQGDPEMIVFLQTAFGYSISGDTAEEKIFFIHGQTRTAKSTIIEAIKATLGDYSATASFESFLRRSFTDGSAHRGDIARLAGARFVCSIEVAEGKELAVGLAKMLSGGDTIVARFPYGREFEYRPQFKLWLAANHKPRIDADDAAMWARLVVIHFEHQVPEDKRDPKVKADLRNPDIAGSAILRWLVEGYLRYRRDGLQLPKAVAAATREYRTDMDDVGEFIQDRLIFDPKATARNEDLRTTFKSWCEDNAQKIDFRRLANRLKLEGCKPVSVGKGRGWAGVRIGK